MKTIIVEIQNEGIYAFSVSYTDMAYKFAASLIREGEAVSIYCLREDSRLPLAV